VGWQWIVDSGMTVAELTVWGGSGLGLAVWRGSGQSGSVAWHSG
jgi:hypothetical protein